MRASSSAASGSSMTSRRGRASSARPIATRCFSPPDRFAGRRPSNPPIPSSSTTWSISPGRPPVRDVPGREPASVKQVLPHGHVRKQAAFLKDIADAALLRRHEQAAFGVGQRLAVDDDAAMLRADQPGDDVDQRCLARAGAAEQRGQPALGRERGVEHEGAEAVADRDLDHVSGRAPGGRRARRPAPRETAPPSRSRPRPASAAARRFRRREPASAYRSRSAGSASRRGCSTRR